VNVAITPVHLLAGLSVAVVLLVVWRGSRRRARAAADAARQSVRLLSLTGRVLLGAALLAGVQWLALTYPGAHWSLRVAALGLPALFASYTLTKALTVTTVDYRRRGGRS
jgi:hypothetical protein